MSAPTIVVTGGGSGGHITPILAVAAAIKRQAPGARIIYIGQTGDGLADVPAADLNIDLVQTVRAGKFRRYKTLGWRQIFYPKINVLNLRDLAYIAIGTVQSWLLLRRLKPAVVFTRGGFVSVPVAVAAHWLRIPYITHDSDSTPSLANRLIARNAAVHALALPPEVYPYPQSKTVMVGIPLSEQYQPVTKTLQYQYRTELGLPTEGLMVLVTGGGNGAHQLNQAVLASVPALLQQHKKLLVVHVAGRALEAALATDYDDAVDVTDRPRVVVKGFVSDMYRYSGAADVIIGRGGATNMAEWALQRKACIIIPSPQLIWNVKNNQLLTEKSAIVQITETEAANSDTLTTAIDELLTNSEHRSQLANSLASLRRGDAADHVASILIELADGATHAAR